MSVLRPRLSRATSLAKSPFSVRRQSTERRLESIDDWLTFREERNHQKGLIELFSNYGSTTNANTTFKLRDSLHNPQAYATTSALLAAGAHFGHASTRMNPNFIPYAYGTRAGITIIDMDHTVPLLRRAANLTRAVARAGGIILFIGTRPDLRPIVHKASERIGQQGYYIGDRWLPGTLSNRKMFFGEDTEKFRMIPDLVVILNPLHNTIAISECAAEHIPTVGIIDSNVDPRLVMYPIPANDENPRTAELIAGVLSIAGREGADLRRIDLANAEKSEESSRNRGNDYM